MKRFLTVKPLPFFPAVALGSIFGRQYMHCTGEATILPAGTPVFTELPEPVPGRWFVKAEGTQAFGFVGLEGVKLTDGKFPNGQVTA